jgi:hypothetical protein
MFQDFSRFSGKDRQGSTKIRVDQVIKYWPGASIYRYGAKPDVLILQKVYLLADYQMPVHYPGIRILDICDPDWMNSWIHIVETCNAMDAITCPTENMAKFLRQFHNNVHIVPDRFDLEVIPKPKKHTKNAKNVVWFGYSHNAGLLKPAIPSLDRLGLNLTIISNEDPYVDRWSTRPRDEWLTFVKYDEDTIYQELQKADYALLPEGFRPEDHFKSNNKSVKAKLAGLPVARNIEDMNRYADPKERQSWLDNNYATIAKEYDVRRSVEQMKGIIDDIKTK